MSATRTTASGRSSPTRSVANLAHPGRHHDGWACTRCGRYTPPWWRRPIRSSSWRAPMVASAVVTVTFFVVTITGFWLLFGAPRGAVRDACRAHPGATSPIGSSFLSTDGIAMTMWAASLVATALYATRGQMRWLAAVAIAVLLLALARPTGSLAPFVPLICAPLPRSVARRPEWRRFGAATLAAAVPAGLVLRRPAPARLPRPERRAAGDSHAAFRPAGHRGSRSATRSRLGIWALTDRLLPTLLSDPSLLGRCRGRLHGLRRPATMVDGAVPGGSPR